MSPGSTGLSVRKTARYAGEDRGALQLTFESCFDIVTEFRAPLARHRHKIVGVTHQLRSCPLRRSLRTVEQRIKPVQVDIRQHRRDHTSLRSPLLRAAPLT